MLTSNPYRATDGQRVGGTVGFPLPGVKLRVHDERGLEVNVGQIGGIEVKGPNVFKGYWRMPEKTAEEFTTDLWFKTGDVGKIDHDGRVTIVGRSKDLIISGGYNVYPAEIESYINEMFGVAESAVVGVPHPDFGEAVVAVVAQSREAAVAAAEAVWVDYAGLPAVSNARAAMQPGAPALCEAAPDNVAAEMRSGQAEATDAAFALAAHVVKLDLVNQRLAPSAMEPRVVLAEPEAGTGRLLLTLSSQMPTAVRDGIAGLLPGLTPEQVLTHIPVAAKDIRAQPPSSVMTLVNVKGVKLAGSLEVSEKDIALDLDVPFLLRPFKGQALKVIEEEIRTWIGKSKNGQI